MRWMGWPSRGARLLCLLIGLLVPCAPAQIPTDGRSGRVSPFRGGQSTFMFRWDISAEDYLEKSWLDQPQALGPFFGLRPMAMDQGITFAGTYTGTVVGNVLGGASRGTAYLDDLFLSATVDLGKLWGLDGWSVGISLRDTDGSFIGDIVGTTPIMDPVSPGNRSFRLGQLSLTWQGLDDTVAVTVGRLVLNNHFAQIPQTALFLNASMSGYPGSIASDITFTGTNSARWGATFNYQPFEYLYLLTGVFSANPNLEVNSAHGLDFSLPPKSGTVTLAELGFFTGHYAPAAGSPAPAASGPEAWFGGNPGAYKIGGIVSTAPFTDLDTGEEAYGNWGLYATASQMVYAEPGGAAEQEGLTLFAAITYFQPERSAVPWFFSGGMFYQGLLPGRPADQCGVAFSCAFFNENAGKLAQVDSPPGQTNEMAVEFTYSFALTDWAYVAPDLQVIVNPGASGQYPTALTIGFKTGVSF